MLRKVPDGLRLGVGLVSAHHQTHDDKVGFGDFEKSVYVRQFRWHSWRRWEIPGQKTLVHRLGLSKILHRLAKKFQVTGTLPNGKEIQ